jgi:hypothetical protein
MNYNTKEAFIEDSIQRVTCIEKKMKRRKEAAPSNAIWTTTASQNLLQT